MTMYAYIKETGEIVACGDTAVVNAIMDHRANGLFCGVIGLTKAPDRLIEPKK